MAIGLESGRLNRKVEKRQKCPSYHHPYGVCIACVCVCAVRRLAERYNNFHPKTYKINNFLANDPKHMYGVARY